MEFKSKFGHGEVVGYKPVNKNQNKNQEGTIESVEFVDVAPKGEDDEQHNPDIKAFYKIKNAEWNNLDIVPEGNILGLVDKPTDTLVETQNEVKEKISHQSEIEQDEVGEVSAPTTTTDVDYVKTGDTDNISPNSEANPVESSSIGSGTVNVTENNLQEEKTEELKQTPAPETNIPVEEKTIINELPVGHSVDNNTPQ